MTYRVSGIRRLFAVHAAWAPAGLARGRSAGPAGSRAARGERSEPLDEVTQGRSTSCMPAFTLPGRTPVYGSEGERALSG